MNKRVVLAKKNDVEGGKQRIKVTVCWGSSGESARESWALVPKGRGAGTLQGPDSGSALGRSWAWLGSRTWESLGLPVFFQQWKPCGKGLSRSGGGDRKPSNPFSFMRPFLGSSRALADFVTVVCMHRRELIWAFLQYRFLGNRVN